MGVSSHCPPLHSFRRCAHLVHVWIQAVCTRYLEEETDIGSSFGTIASPMTTPLRALTPALNSIRHLTDCVATEALQLCFRDRSSGGASSPGALAKLRLWQTSGTASDSSSCSHPLTHSSTTFHSSHTFQEKPQHLQCHGFSISTAPSVNTSIFQLPSVRNFSSQSRRAFVAHTFQKSSNTRSSSYPSSILALSFSTSSKEQSATPVPASEGGAASNPWINTPNLLSMGRAVSGPVIAYLIMEDQWAIAITALAVSGVSQT